MLMHRAEMTTEGDQDLITIQYTREPGRLRRLFGATAETWTERHIGRCTIWRTYPEFVRCSTHREAWLCDLWHRLRHEKARKAP